MFLPILFLVVIIIGIIGMISQGHEQGDNTNNRTCRNDSYTNNSDYYNDYDMSFRSNNNDNPGSNNQNNRDPFKIDQYKNEIDFYDDNMEEFSRFEEAEDYFNDNRE